MADSTQTQGPQNTRSTIVGGDDRFALTSTSRIAHIRFSDLFESQDYQGLTQKEFLNRLSTKVQLILLRSRDFSHQLSQPEKDLLTDLVQTICKLEDIINSQL